ncbi:MAG: hypothetical protein JO108_23095, partial [Acidobacteriaceae bacterium]|nr:hypothetical protein [Acidobacteriaceae bacterium]
MSILSNLRIRTKVLIALLVMAVMVIAVALYASIEMRKIDSWYSDLIDHDVQGIENLTVAMALNDRFGQLLYK